MQRGESISLIINIMFDLQSIIVILLIAMTFLPIFLVFLVKMHLSIYQSRKKMIVLESLQDILESDQRHKELH